MRAKLMDTLIKCASYEFTVKGSRFLSELIPCRNGEARGILKAQKAKYSNATHVVHAFICGKAGEVRGLSDDGEPAGTAGRPVMDVLAGRHCTNAMLTVTRWFGGTLLGTGGLVKAYSDAAKGVIAAAEAEGAFIELAEMEHFHFTAGYAAYNALIPVLESFRLQDVKRQFGGMVEVSGNVRQDEAEAFLAAVRDASGGAVVVDSK